VTQQFVQIDAFSNQPFAGNPAAVCVLDAYPDATWMQQVAAEMNLSETAYLCPRGEYFELRWFTPTVEVDLCGHATLASAHHLWELELLAASATARFHTASGLLTARKHGEWIEMDFPSEPAEQAPGNEELLSALRCRALWFGRNRMDYLIELESEEEVRGLRPDFAGIARCEARGVIVTSRAASGEYDFVSRFFAPASGVDEDPVTGSAHCCLAPFWASRLQKDCMVGYQASERGGIVGVEFAGERTLLRGQAVTVVRGEILADSLQLPDSRRS